MKFNTWRHALCACSLAVAAGAPAQATVITFDNVEPGTLLFPDESFSLDGFVFTVLNGPSIVDTPSAFGPGTGLLDLAGPTGNLSPFYIGLNNANLRMEAEGGGAFRLLDIDFGYVAALTNLHTPGEEAAILVVVYQGTNGDFDINLDFFPFGPADANGAFGFQSLASAYGRAFSSPLLWVEFSACAIDASGFCGGTDPNGGGFALDNIRVPEPGSLALTLAALALMAGCARRKA